jgi:hypothetical protein
VGLGRVLNRGASSKWYRTTVSKIYQTLQYDKMKDKEQLSF